MYDPKTMRRLKADEYTETCVNAYLACALWASTDDDGEPLDYTFDTDAFPISQRNAAVHDVRAFLEMYPPARNLPAAALGYDLWLTRNGHGAGFWDRGYDDGDVLTEHAHNLGSVDIYVHRGRLYFT